MLTRYCIQEHLNCQSSQFLYIHASGHAGSCFVPLAGTPSARTHLSKALAAARVGNPSLKEISVWLIGEASEAIRRRF